MEQGLKVKKILVSGGRGFVGSVLAKRREDEEAKVSIVDVQDGVDISDWPQLAALSDFDCHNPVYHLVALSYVPSAWTDSREVYQKNILGP